MKQKFTLLLVIFLPMILQSQSFSLFDSYKIPTYTYHSMNIYGQDFLNYLKSTNLDNSTQATHFNLNIGSTETHIKQSPMSTHSGYGFIEAFYNYDKDPAISRTASESSLLRLTYYSYHNWYLTHEKGLFIFADPALRSSYNFTSNVKSHLIDIPFGVGYGRIIGVKSVVQSYIISDEVGASLQDSTLLKLAEVIDNYNNGYYDAIFRDSSKIAFYDDIAKLTNKPEQAQKIEQILESPLYKTSQREIGWEIKLGINTTLASSEQILPSSSGYQTTQYGNGSDLLVSGEFALPIDFDKQFSASVIYSSNLDKDYGRVPKLSISASFSIDHNYTWASSIIAYAKTAYPDYGDDWKNYYAGIRSEYVMFNSMSIYCNFGYLYQEFGEMSTLQWSPITVHTTKSETIQFHLGFNYYIM